MGHSTKGVGAQHEGGVSGAQYFLKEATKGDRVVGSHPTSYVILRSHIVMSMTPHSYTIPFFPLTCLILNWGLHVFISTLLTTEMVSLDLAMGKLTSLGTSPGIYCASNMHNLNERAGREKGKGDGRV